MDCGIKLDKSYDRGDVCQKCFGEFNGATIEELIQSNKNMNTKELTEQVIRSHFEKLVSLMKQEWKDEDLISSCILDDGFSIEINSGDFDLGVTFWEGSDKYNISWCPIRDDHPHEQVESIVREIAKNIPNLSNTMSYRELVGKTEEEARKFCEENKFKFRIVKKDGQNFLGTCDYRLDRVNVEIKDGIVTVAKLG